MTSAVIDRGEAARPRRACFCGAEDAHLYACGWRCAEHTPARLAGEPEPGIDRYCAPARCYCGGCPSWGKHMVMVDYQTIVDIRAIAEGKRRAPMHEYRAAQADLAARRAAQTRTPAKERQATRPAVADRVPAGTPMF